MNTEIVERKNSAETYAERRAHKRHAVDIEATLHAGGKSQPTIINDLSTGGAGLNGAIGIFANDKIEVELKDGRRIAGNVVWWLSGCCGIRFAEALVANDPLIMANRS